MSKKHFTRNVNGLLTHSKTKSLDTEERIETAINHLLSQNLSVNFNSVSKLANVSKSTLYNKPNIREKIETLRQKGPLKSHSTKKSVITDSGKDVIIAAKNKKIRDLEAEVEKLSKALKRCYANEYDKF